MQSKALRIEHIFRAPNSPNLFALPEGDHHQFTSAAGACILTDVKHVASKEFTGQVAHTCARFYDVNKTKIYELTYKSVTRGLHIPLHEKTVDLIIDAELLDNLKSTFQLFALTDGVTLQLVSLGRVMLAGSYVEVFCVDLFAAIGHATFSRYIYSTPEYRQKITRYPTTRQDEPLHATFGKQVSMF